MLPDDVEESKRPESEDKEERQAECVQGRKARRPGSGRRWDSRERRLGAFSFCQNGIERSNAVAE